MLQPVCKTALQVADKQTVSFTSSFVHIQYFSLASSHDVKKPAGISHSSSFFPLQSLMRLPGFAFPKQTCVWLPSQYQPCFIFSLPARVGRFALRLRDSAEIQGVTMLRVRPQLTEPAEGEVSLISHQCSFVFWTGRNSNFHPMLLKTVKGEPDRMAYRNPTNAATCSLNVHHSMCTAWCKLTPDRIREGCCSRTGSLVNRHDIYS